MYYNIFSVSLLYWREEMKDWKHINFEQRKVMSPGISHNYKLKEIADTLGLNPTSISKEVN